MNKMVLKFPLTFVGTGYPEAVKLPKGAEILCVKLQRHVPTIWALVDPLIEYETRSFELFNTGQPIPADMGTERKYIATFIDDGGDYVGHIFERLN